MKLDIEDGFLSCTTCLRKSKKQAIKNKCKIKSNFTLKFWWDKETEELYQIIQKLQGRFMKLSNIENLLNLNKAKAKFRRQKISINLNTGKNYWKILTHKHPAVYYEIE